MFTSKRKRPKKITIVFWMKICWPRKSWETKSILKWNFLRLCKSQSFFLCILERKPFRHSKLSWTNTTTKSDPSQRNWSFWHQVLLYKLQYFNNNFSILIIYFSPRKTKGRIFRMANKYLWASRKIVYRAHGRKRRRRKKTATGINDALHDESIRQNSAKTLANFGR